MKKNNKNNGQRQGTGKILLALAAEKLDISVEKAVRYMQHLGYTVKKGSDAYITQDEYEKLCRQVWKEHSKEEKNIVADRMSQIRKNKNLYNTKKCDNTINDLGDDEIKVLGKNGFEKCVEDYFKRILDTNNAAAECSAEVPKTSNVEKLLGEIVNDQKKLIRIVEEIGWKIENINDKINLKVNSTSTPTPTPNPNPNPNPNYPNYYHEKISNKGRS